MEIDNDTRAQILAEIIEMTQGEPIADDEFTVRQFEAASGLSRRRAAMKLERLIEQGKLEKRRALVNGAWCNAYRKA